jgi:PhnB protein
MPLNPYLHFNGNAEEALEHYRSALGGDIEIMRWKGSPAEGYVPADWGSKVMHGRLSSPAGVIMAADGSPESAGKTGDNVSIAVHPESEAAADAIFAKLSDGGQVTMALEKTFFSKKFGMLVDKFGVSWMVNCL